MAGCVLAIALAARSHLGLHGFAKRSVAHTSAKNGLGTVHFSRGTVRFFGTILSLGCLHILGIYGLQGVGLVQVRRSVGGTSGISTLCIATLWLVGNRSWSAHRIINLLNPVAGNTLTIQVVCYSIGAVAHCTTEFSFCL